MIKTLDDKTFKEQIINYAKGPEAPYEIKRNTVIEFFLPSCSHCQAMWPVIEAATIEFPDIDFYKIDASEYPEVAALYNIQGTPTFILIPLKGKPKMNLGQMPLEEFSELIKSVFR